MFLHRSLITFSFLTFLQSLMFSRGGSPTPVATNIACGSCGDGLPKPLLVREPASVLRPATIWSVSVCLVSARFQMIEKLDGDHHG